MEDMSESVMVFDSGLGSFDVAHKIHEAFKDKKVLYLADHEAFPYGEKEAGELLEVVSDSIEYGKQRGIRTFVLASVTPSLTVLNVLRKLHPGVTIYGIMPPVKRALERSKTGKVAVLCTEGVAKSEALAKYITEVAPDQEQDVYVYNASPLISGLVESGLFLSDKEKTAVEVGQYIDNILEAHPDIDTFALSSTHLPWLNNKKTGEYFKEACPGCSFVEPSADIMQELKAAWSQEGGKEGSLKAITTSGQEEIRKLQAFFSAMGADVEVQNVSFRHGRGRAGGGFGISG